METECVVCGSPHALAACQSCGKIICPSHRVGTGSLADGYTCVGAGSSCWLRFYVGDELKPPKPKIQRWNWEVADTRFVLIVLGLVGLGIAMGFLVPGHH